ncbi:MAG: aminotransferase class I/II-fold pyridoxal phosphate-dependent enzyme [Victivallales bacterium]|nr:aminotransferase class I/II-fold pyridoxal phosphate-dependent enzyme [Victivallales bacterium]
MSTKDLRFHPEALIAGHISALPKSGIRDFFELVNQMDDVISLGIGEPDFPTPWHIRESAIYSLEKGHTSYTSNLGLMSLREEISRYLSKLYDLEYCPVSQCIVTVGVSEALDLLLRAIINPGDEIIYHEPCYVSYSPCVRMAHGIPVAIPTFQKNHFALDPEDLRKSVTRRTKAILLNFPCNPTGAKLNTEQLRRIAEIAIEKNLLVIADEIYSELTYEGSHVSIATVPGMYERTVFLHGFSKAYSMTGFRVGFACGPASIIDAMMKIHQYSMLCAPTIAQESAVEALRNGHSAMLDMKEEYCERRNVISKHLNEMGLSCFKPEGAFYIFPNISSTGMTSKDFATRLLSEQNVALVPGPAFGACGEGYVRCSYATSIENIVEAMRRIKTFLRQ